MDPLISNAGIHPEIQWDSKKSPLFPSNIEWDLTNGPLSELLELLHIQV